MIVQLALILILMIQITATNLNKYPLDVIIRLMDIFIYK